MGDDGKAQVVTIKEISSSRWKRFKQNRKKKRESVTV